MVKGLLVSSTGEQGRGTTGDWKLDVCSGIHQIQDTSNLYLQHNTGARKYSLRFYLEVSTVEEGEAIQSKTTPAESSQEPQVQPSFFPFFFFNTTKKQNKTAQQDLVQM